MTLRLLRIPSTLWGPSWVVQMCISLRSLWCWRSCSLQYFPLSPKSRSVFLQHTCHIFEEVYRFDLMKVLLRLCWCVWGKFFSIAKGQSDPALEPLKPITKEKLHLLRKTGYLQLAPKLLAPLVKYLRPVSFSKVGWYLNFKGRALFPENLYQ